MLLPFKFFDDPVSNSLVKIISAKPVVTSCCKNFNYSVTNLNDRYIKGSLKYAGTVITASVTGSPKKFSASFFNCIKINALTVCGL